MMLSEDKIRNIRSQKVTCRDWFKLSDSDQTRLEIEIDLLNTILED